MVIHLFMLRWKPEATQADRDRALTEIRAFQGVVPGLLETCAGVNFSVRSNGHELGCAMRFTDRAALEAYFMSPVHEDLLRWLVPLVDATDLDFSV